MYKNSEFHTTLVLKNKFVRMKNRHMKQHKLITVIAFIIPFIIACNTTTVQDCNLEEAGNNRVELEKVLNHYKNDKDKLQAARFLINNMRYHSFPCSPELDEYYNLLDSVSILTDRRDNFSPAQDSLFKLLNPPSVQNAEMISDITCLSADFLIRHIDRAFEAWQGPWAKHLTFDEFCEYLLPYRVGKEKPTDGYEAFRDSAYAMAKEVLDTCEYTRADLQNIAWEIGKKYAIRIIYSSRYPGGHDARMLINMRRGVCREYSELGVHMFRSLGIPATIDLIPQWANRSMGHDWNVFMTERGQVLDYSFSALHDTIGHHTKERIEKFAKVYRMTYSAQHGALALESNETTFIPQLFNNPCMKDVTELYLKNCKDIKIPLNKQSGKRPQYAYLCTFDNQEWKPVQWAETGRLWTTFKKMGRGIAYLPAYYDNGYIEPAASPIILHENGRVQKLIPDTCKRQKLILTRKYTEGIRIQRFSEKIKGCYFQVANKADFSDSVTVYTIKEAPEVNFNTIPLALDSTYRYFRYVSPAENEGGNISDLVVYDKEGKTLKGTVSGNTLCYGGYGPETVFDDDILTYYFCFSKRLGWAALDFGERIHIGSFRFLPRNDDNFIREGELYELFYWNNEWISLGQQTGTNSQKLEYNNAPVNALFLLSNLTKGKEERIFTYENGKQVWW